MICLWFCCYNQIVLGIYLLLVPWSLDYLHAWCVWWVPKLAKWHVRHGGAWMGTWFEYWFWELEFLDCWHFYHDALLVSLDINLYACCSSYLPTNHQSGAKTMFLSSMMSLRSGFLHRMSWMLWVLFIYNIR